VRYNYSSLTTPYSVYDYNTRDKRRTLLKREEVQAGFDQNNYVTERLWAAAHDGIKVPVSVVYRKGEPAKSARPLLQYGYGSYGLSSDAYFNPFVISLLDRGFVYAIAHIRGGQEMGRQWYDDGKLMKKKNTFRDFISVTEHLVKSGYADPKRVYAMGGSAGGLLMGAVMNMRPDLYHGMVAMVPFVDVVTTMLDDTIPLTTFEYDEWGNPNEQAAHEYMLSYSPYDQVEKKAYPHLLVTTGLHDSQVQYWEPAKWVARLRTRKTDHNLVLMRTNMDAGHGGASARYQYYEEVARIYAFLLDRAGKAPVTPPSPGR
jgi:oligopeptidase B